jgi:hypothetical protein
MKFKLSHFSFKIFLGLVYTYSVWMTAVFFLQKNSREQVNASNDKASYKIQNLSRLENTNASNNTKRSVKNVMSTDVQKLQSFHFELSPVKKAFPYVGSNIRRETWPLFDAGGVLTEEAASDAGLSLDEYAIAKKIFDVYSSKFDELVIQHLEEVESNDEKIKKFIIKPFGENAVSVMKNLIDDLSKNFGQDRQVKLLEKFDINRYSGMGHYKTTLNMQEIDSTTHPAFNLNNLSPVLILTNGTGVEFGSLIKKLVLD